MTAGGRMRPSRFQACSPGRQRRPVQAGAARGTVLSGPCPTAEAGSPCGASMSALRTYSRASRMTPARLDFGRRQPLHARAPGDRLAHPTPQSPRSGHCCRHATRGRRPHQHVPACSRSRNWPTPWPHRFVRRVEASGQSGHARLDRARSSLTRPGPSLTMRSIGSAGGEWCRGSRQGRGAVATRMDG